MERPLSLLLVEDERTLRMLVAQFLRRSQARVIEAADGLEAVERFEDSGPFDLVLMDLNMPGVSGVEACRRIRQQYPGQQVLICSGAILDEHRRELDELGIAHYLSKPFHPEALVDRIRESLDGKLRLGQGASNLASVA